jgi:sterol desaturase/sphingolipid hydroxylase (fatty acid hydroxylase superfamily)
VDTVTGVRFHPIEALISMVVKLAAAGLLGAPAVAVLTFEVLLNASSLFNHANIRLPTRLESLFRLFIVTPGMHRIHHSVNDTEHNRNFGFSFPWWDRIFGTYQAQPNRAGSSLGLPIFRGGDEQTLYALLTQPFRTSKGQPRLNRSDTAA